MNIIQATSSAMSNIITWKGRASRSEFWWFYLVYLLIYYVGVYLSVSIGGTFGTFGTFVAFVYSVLMLALTLVLLSCFIRRLHDIGLSGWWYWVAFAPFVIDRNDSASGKSTYLVLFGFMYSIKMLITKGEEVENQYGPDPL